MFETCGIFDCIIWSLPQVCFHTLATFGSLYWRASGGCSLRSLKNSRKNWKFCSHKKFKLFECKVWWSSVSYRHTYRHTNYLIYIDKVLYSMNKWVAHCCIDVVFREYKIGVFLQQRRIRDERLPINANAIFLSSAWSQWLKNVSFEFSRQNINSFWTIFVLFLDRFWTFLNRILDHLDQFWTDFA